MFKDFNKFIYDHTLYRGQKHFWRFCLQALSIEKKLKRYLKDYFKIKGKLRIQIPKKGEQVKFKNFERKIKTSFMIYPDFEGILVSEIMQSKILMSFLSTNTKNMLLAVMAINW